MPCEGVPLAPPPAPGIGSLTLGSETHQLERSTLGGIPGTALVFFLGDSDDVLALRLSENDPSLAPAWLEREGRVVAIDNAMVNGLSGATGTTTINVSGRLGGQELRAEIPPAAVLNGSTRVRIEGQQAFIEGDLGRLTYRQIADLRTNHPGVDTLVLRNVPAP